MRGRQENRLCLWWTLIVAQFCLGTALGQPILLHLRNGDRLSGQVVAEEAGQITITNTVLGRLAVPLAHIERREWITNRTAGAPATVAATNLIVAVTPASQKSLTDLQAAYLAGQLSPDEYHRQRAKLLEQGQRPAVAAARTNVPPLVPAKPGPKHWSGEVFLGTDLAYSAKDRELYSGRLKLNYASPPLRNAFDYQFTYGRTDGELSANRMDGLMKTDYDLTQKVYLYSLGTAGYDEIRKIDWRYELGPGAGYPLFKTTNFLLRVEGGVNYQVQNFEGDRQDEVFYNRLAQDLKWNLGTLFTFDEKAEYMPEVGDFQVYRLRLEANARYWLRSNLSLNFTVINLYDTMTAPGVGQNDLQLRSSIGLKF